MTLSNLYQQVILEHNKKPLGFGEVDGADIIIDKHNVVCGDEIRLGVWRQADTVQRVGFTGESCAICTASASMLCEYMRDLSLIEAERACQAFIAFINAEPSADQDLLNSNLLVFSELKKIPTRQRCATLPWEALVGAVSDDR